MTHEDAWADRYATIYRFVRRRTSSAEDAEDVTQDVFAAAAAALAEARLNAASPPLAWLYTVARRRLIDRTRILTPIPAEDSAEAAARSDDEARYGLSLAQAILNGLRELNEKDRQVIVMKLFEGRAFAEIAAVVGAREEACRMRFSRGLDALRERLEQKGVTP